MTKQRRIHKAVVAGEKFIKRIKRAGQSRQDRKLKWRLEFVDIEC